MCSLMRCSLAPERLVSKTQTMPDSVQWQKKTVGLHFSNDGTGAYNVDDDHVVFECEGSRVTRNGINAPHFFLSRARFRLNPTLCATVDDACNGSFVHTEPVAVERATDCVCSCWRMIEYRKSYVTCGEAVSHSLPKPAEQVQLLFPQDFQVSSKNDVPFGSRPKRTSVFFNNDNDSSKMVNYY